MKKRYFFFSSGAGAVDRPFIIQVNSGADSSFTIPTYLVGYNYKVSTSDGQNFTGVTGNLTITFPSANTLYDVSISGDFPGILFNYGSERLKIKDIKQWGDIAWGAVQNSAFYGCEDMVCSALDSPDLVALTNGAYMFNLASSFNPSNFATTLENLTNGSFMFYGASSFNPPNFAPTLENLMNGGGMFYDAINFAQDIYAPNSVNLEYDNSMFLNTKVGKITLNNSSLTFTDASSFVCSQLTDLILIDRKIDLWIDKAPLLTGTKIDALANSVADMTGQTSVTVTMTQVQYNSCDTTIWTNKNWTIAIAEMLTLSVNDTSQANLRIDTHSGLPYYVDWGDGVFEPYLSGQEATKVYTANFTGDIKVVAPMGLGDISRFESNNNSTAWDFDLGVVVPLTGLNYFRMQNLPNANITGSLNSFSGANELTYLRLQGNSFTGDMSGVSSLTSLTSLYLIGNSLTGDMSGVNNLTSLTSLQLQGNSLTGDMSGVSNLTSLTYLYLQGNFTISYTSTTFAPNFRYWLFRPTTAINAMDSSEIDQMLADASQTTWTLEKQIYVDGNNGVRTSASDADVATLQAMGVTLYLNV